MIILGLVLLVVGLLVAGLHILFTIGIVILIVGLALALLGGTGHQIGGRSHWY